MTQPKKVNYLNNKDILKQIHQSKMTYCYVQDDRYSDPDIIVIPESQLKYLVSVSHVNCI